ncbi:MAG: hypothetical protein RIQ60_2942 [Pseudomonadota bacterium]|jgi:uncharacterized membrane protein
MSPILFKSAELSALPLAVSLHLAVALGAVLLGPLALRARKGTTLHRGAGYVWISLMLLTAVSSLFIRDVSLPNLAGYTPIHLFTLLTFAGVFGGLRHIVQRRVQQHRRVMRSMYVSLLIAGAFTLLPGRYLGSLLWHHTLGLV